MLAALDWLRSAAALARGTLLLIDYGSPRHEYYHPQRDQRHACAAISAIARTISHCCIRACRTSPPGWISRAWPRRAVDARTRGRGLLHAGGLPAGERVSRREVALPTRDLLQRARLASQARALLLPAEMGESFKVMALTRGLR